MSFYKEPEYKCPKCGVNLHTEWVDNGFGPYSVQVSPYHCEDCDWVEQGCPQQECILDKCISFDVCKGRATVKESFTDLSKLKESR